MTPKPEISTYDCRECINRASPICEDCRQITAPGGKEQKPTKYIRQSDASRLICREFTPCKPDRMAALLMMHIQRNEPLPTALVMIYNDIAKKEE